MTPAERRQMMLVGPILPTILTLAAPNVLNVAMQSLVSISDSWFVSQLGLVDLAALALVFPTQMALGQMSAGAMGGGVSSSVARALGSGNRAAAEAAAAHALVIAHRHGRPVRDRAGRLRPADLRRAGRQRPRARRRRGLRVGSVPRLRRALDRQYARLGAARHGRHEDAGYALVATAALQVPLTGALTLGWFGLPKLGIIGPAAAAVIVFTLAALWMLSRLIGPKAAIRLRWPLDGFRWRSFRDILKVGLVACLVVILTNGTVLLVTGLIGRAGDAAIAGYGIGSRLEYMLVPISFGIGATLTALVGTNIGARQFARAQRVAWSGALMAGGIAAAIGIVVAIEPDLWLRLFTDDPAALASGRTYLSIVGPVYGFFGLAMALYFASQGTGEMVWPVIANLCRILIAVCGSLLALDVMGWGLRGLFTFVALGIVCFSAVLAFSTTRPAWRAP